MHMSLHLLCSLASFVVLSYLPLHWFPATSLLRWNKNAPPQVFLKNLRYFIQTAWSTTGSVLCSLVAKSHLTPCHLMDCSLLGSSVHGIPQARILGGLPFPSPKGSSQPRDRTHIFCTAGRFFTIWATREALININGKLFWSCLPAWDLHRSSPLFFSWPCYTHLLKRPQSLLIPDITKGEFPSPAARSFRRTELLTIFHLPMSQRNDIFLWNCHRFRETAVFICLAFVLLSPNFSGSVSETATLPVGTLTPFSVAPWADGDVVSKVLGHISFVGRLDFGRWFFF